MALKRRCVCSVCPDGGDTFLFRNCRTDYFICAGCGYRAEEKTDSCPECNGVDFRREWINFPDLCFCFKCKSYFAPDRQ